MSKSVTVFSCDPGTQNFACSVMQGRLTKTGLEINIIGTAMVPVTLKDMKANVAEQLIKFRNLMRHVKKVHSPNITCFERYQSRGLKGNTIEAIGYMMGVVAMVFRKTDPQFILASTWKNRANRIDGVDLKEIYKGWGLTSMAKAYTGKRDHELDALLIGLYKIHQHFGLEDFVMLDRMPLEEFKEMFLNCPKLELPEF